MFITAGAARGAEHRALAARQLGILARVTTEGVPERLGPYRVDGVLGAGGMGVVYRGVDASGGRAAIKVVRASFTSREALIRFEREARVRVDHPNVVRVLDTGTTADGAPYIAFELLEGESLAQRLVRGALSCEDAIDLGIQLADGLAAAHEAGVVHRDLKPSNVFCCADGTAKILDFGVARSTAGATELTATGRVVGTLDYLSPEQAEGKQMVDARSDVWSLGAVLYEAVAGRPPFRQETPIATIVAILLSDLPPIDRDLPRALTEVLARALTKDRRGRIESARTFGAALREARERLSLGGARRHTSTIPPGERRIVAVLLATDVRDGRALGAAIEEDGGSALPLLGARMLGLFGAERTAGDELIRALTVAARARGTSGRIAVASGRVSSSHHGMEGSALEEAEAASEAGVDGVAVTAAAARSLPTELSLAAISDSVFEISTDAILLSELSATSSGEPHVGRAAEVALLERVVETALESSRATVALVVGPEGMGKTRMRMELERRLAEETRPVEVLFGRAEPHRSERALALFSSLLRSTIHTAAAESPEAAIAALVRGVGDVSEAARVRADLALVAEATHAREAEPSAAGSDLLRIGDRLQLSVLSWLEGVAAAGHVALVLEDLHFADPVSLQLLERFVGAERETGLLVFASARPELLDRRPDIFGDADLFRIDLHGLTRAAVARLAETAARRPLPEETVSAIHERTQGNPFFVQQIVLALADRGAAEPGAELPLPLTVEAAVQSRLDQLPASEKDLCKRAAIYGRPFTAEDSRGARHHRTGAAASLAPASRRHHAARARPLRLPEHARRRRRAAHVERRAAREAPRDRCVVARGRARRRRRGDCGASRERRRARRGRAVVRSCRVRRGPSRRRGDGPPSVGRGAAPRRSDRASSSPPRGTGGRPPLLWLARGARRGGRARAGLRRDRRGFERRPCRSARW